MQQATRHSQPFTHSISNLLGLVCVLYLLANVSFVFACGPERHLRQICSLAGPALSVAPIIPAITKPKAYLIALGNADRAEAVQLIYSFAWVSAIAVVILMMLVVGGATFCLSAAERKRAASFYEHHRQRARANEAQVQAGIAFLVSAAVLAFLDVFWGFYDFTGSSRVLNMVHLRDGDLFRMGFVWTLLLLLLMLAMLWGARRYVVKRSATTMVH
jgi:hypothetical protein